MEYEEEKVTIRITLGTIAIMESNSCIITLRSYAEDKRYMSHQKKVYNFMASAEKFIHLCHWFNLTLLYKLKIFTFSPHLSHSF